MASCKDCMHYDVCEARIAADENYPERNYTENNNCSNFKDRTRFVELPKKGDTVYGFDYPRSDIKVVVPEEITGIALETDCDFYKITDLGKTVFLTREEAEKALSNPAKSDS